MNQKTGRRLVGVRSGGDCELRILDVCIGRATDWQHRRNRSQGGTWAPSNGIHACRACHQHIHGNPVLAGTNGWTVMSWEDWMKKPVLLWMGLVRLDDAGGWTRLGSDMHTAGCAIWTSDDPCDCSVEPHQKEAS